MKNIEFRAWDKIDNNMTDVAAINWIDKIVTLFVGNQEVAKIVLVRRFDDVELMQYTGLCDKNGKEIYEGDIVTATYGRWREEPDGLQRTCKVVYDNKSCSFRLSVRNSMVLASFGDTRKKDLEIIGNIHDNPELLKETP